MQPLISNLKFDRLITFRVSYYVEEKETNFEEKYEAQRQLLYMQIFRFQSEAFQEKLLQFRIMSAKRFS